MLSIITAMLGIELLFYLLITYFKDSKDNFIKYFRYFLIQIFILMIPLIFNTVALVNKLETIYPSSVDFLLMIGTWFWRIYFAYGSLFIGYVFYYLAIAWINHVDRKK